MSIDESAKKHLGIVAEETLGALHSIAEAAKSKTDEMSSIGADVFASINTLTSENAVRSLGRVNSENQSGWTTLVKEPAIARVVVQDEGGNTDIYYICRAAPVTGAVPNLASYRSPVGRLAALPIGAEFSLYRRGQQIAVEIVERAQLRPSVREHEWDSINSTFSGENYGPYTVQSLRELLRQALDDGEESDLLGQILAEENESANLIEGLRRNVINKMALRDQPILDQYQDAIFRLPLSSRLLILGAPGTGKTTTLIRRLGQKLDLAFLEADERDLVERLLGSSAVPHNQSWMMFTPTELLKQYVKEAFARENIAASDHHLKTWTEYRHELARTTFGLLRTAAGGGSFVLKEALGSLLSGTILNQIEWFRDFDSWQTEAFWEEMSSAATLLQENVSAEVAALGRKYSSICRRAGDESTSNVLIQLIGLSEDVRTLLDGLKANTDKEIRGVLNLQMNRDKSFIDKLASFIDELAEGSEESDEVEGEEDEDVLQPKSRLASASRTFIRAVQAQARAQAAGRGLGKNSVNAKVVEWLGNRSLPENRRSEVGNSLLTQSTARRFLNPTRRYIASVPIRYRRFRSIRQSEGRWYSPDGFSSADVSPLEIDLMLLQILRSSRDLIKEPRIAVDLDKPAYLQLASVQRLFKNQILVDEAADFSPLQIACMVALGTPALRSFFACGDFNQRVTEWGVRSLDDMKWTLPDIEVRSVAITYRQSSQLNELARQIVQLTDGENIEVALPEKVANDGVLPVVGMKLRTESEIISWIALRIAEIESFVHQLPSIAILVNSESQVEPIAAGLGQALAAMNIRVLACVRGQMMGQESEVRVFDVQHIKGLEFEAVFFIGVDELAIEQPNLFGKYLYVGATRASTYLGVTCAGATLPQQIAPLRDYFAESWQ